MKRAGVTAIVLVGCVLCLGRCGYKAEQNRLPQAVIGERGAGSAAASATARHKTADETIEKLLAPLTAEQMEANELRARQREQERQAAYERAAKGTLRWGSSDTQPAVQGQGTAAPTAVPGSAGAQGRVQQLQRGVVDQVGVMSGWYEPVVLQPRAEDSGHGRGGGG